MSSPDLGPILDDLAAGRIDTAEANRRINALKGTSTATDDGTTRPGGLSKVTVTAVGRRVRIEGDPKVTTLSVEGPHLLRRNGDVMEVSSTGELGPNLSGFSLIRPQRILDDMGLIGLGKELLIKVNPRLVVDVESTTGGLRTSGVPRLGRVRVTMGGCHLSDVTEVADLLSQAGGVTVEGPISRGRSRLKIESGSLTLALTPGANVVVHAESKFGHVRWPEDNTGVDEVVFGNGSARCDINVMMGLATIKDITKEEN
ncbi:MAG: hypothetical protein Q4D96_11860 [Propionibacteriaceae bacterium]|nr:hypothetical protein [Propionibacteriaceae bacterium]